jgi:hypothetical protein
MKKSLNMTVWSVLLGCTFGTSVSQADFAPNIPFQDVKKYFEEHRLAFEEMVRDVKACPGLKTIEPLNRSNFSVKKCLDGTHEIPTRVALKLRSLHILWATVSWGKYSQPKWDPSVFVGVNFVLQSQGIVTHGSGVSIAYFEEPLTHSVIANGWIPLTDSPVHWSYHASN